MALPSLFMCSAVWRFSSARGSANREESMKAIVWHGKGDVRCDTVPDPKIEDLFDFMYASPVPNTPGREEAIAIAQQMSGGR